MKTVVEVNAVNNAPRTLVAARERLVSLAARWGGRWAMYHAVIDGKEFWPVVGCGRGVPEYWDKVSTCVVCMVTGRETFA